ncbi:hypothetical protein GCM10027280_57300 [Micromonospora polyrhachis]|uniref:PD-(D/E)XK nuclease superfamily protein n=1 Tax=Micromonospora polyrhachis TaxID=1282883 RepID=A0A7W7STX1_9ACTN|nr:hypothetical protein [Micromonospora polyrhachis]MBB4960252.1 hypothetical protein [Micromonospora polyrhachis]
MVTALAVLSHPQVASKADERLLEALLLAGLRCIPGLADALFRCGPDVAFDLGQRGRQADIVGTRAGQIVIECEVKIRSRLNSQQDDDTQLDKYASHAPAEAQLFLLTTQAHHAKLSAYLAHVRSLDRWSLLWLPDVYTAIEKSAGRIAPGDGSAERLACALARLR